MSQAEDEATERVEEKEEEDPETILLSNRVSPTKNADVDPTGGNETEEIENEENQAAQNEEAEPVGETDNQQPDMQDEMNEQNDEEETTNEQSKDIQEENAEEAEPEETEQPLHDETEPSEEVEPSDENQQGNEQDNAEETEQTEEADQVDEEHVDEAEETNAPAEQEVDNKPQTLEKQYSKAESTVTIPTVTPQPPGSPEPDTARVDDVATGTDPTTEAEEPDPHAPSPEAKFPQDATATAKFVLMPTAQVATMRCHLGQVLSQIKSHFASELKIPEEVILIMHDGKITQDDSTLGDLGVEPNGTVQLEIQSADPINQPIRPVQKRTEYHMPDVITVKVQKADGSMQDVVVEIERATRKKPFLGGYRHKNTGVEYHHASVQTIAKPRPQSATEKFCRDTQTVAQRHQVQQTGNPMSTQMSKIGVYVSNMQDKLLAPGRYITASEHEGNILQYIIVIQKYMRRWLAQRAVGRVRHANETRITWEKENEARKRSEKDERIRREYERRMNPKTREDFDLLYHALEKWRKEELERINSTLSGAERKAALCVLLEQETQLVASIGRHKLDAESENRSNKIQGFLDKAAAPKRWKGPDGKETEMDTPYTLRAQQLRDIYNTINMKYLTQDERLDVLLTLKHTVKEHDCKLTQEIVELVDREADLLMRGVKESNLDGLRKRISTLFLQYCKTPVFNPEIARLLKVPQDSTALRANIYFCSSCNKYLPSTDFQLSSKSDTVGRCKRCLKMDNDSRVRQDYSHYRFMLVSLRRTEESYGDASKIAFLLQESDLRYLVENVWGSISALSASEDLYDLELVRWERDREWSPWNCCLLTKDEASAHEKLKDLTEAYGKTFIHRVKHKHTLARNYFSRLPGMAEHLREEATAKSRASTAHAPSVSGKALPIRVT